METKNLDMDRVDLFSLPSENFMPLLQEKTNKQTSKQQKQSTTTTKKNKTMIQF